MTPKQIMHKAIRRKYGTLNLFKHGNVSCSYHKITDRIACMLIHESDELANLYHTELAKVNDDGECVFVKTKGKEFVGFTYESAKERLKYLRVYFKQGNGKDIA